ncbi:uncharacterized protein LOC110047940 [Orbicella faveolata]|uniref:uncharacterized protein LOC110047940 n=1 Tax=Orbicella faveolata TaxID=48498 RepID=UPI0009E254F1|nr:uncharacterized protein LOC110047940 [Orbicella faveolata]
MKEGKIEKSEDRQGGFSSAAHVWALFPLKTISFQDLNKLSVEFDAYDILPYTVHFLFDVRGNLVSRAWLSRDVGIPVACGRGCPMSHDAVRLPHQFHHESMSCFTRALHGLRMAAPRKVAIIGSGNWGSVISRIVGANVKDHPNLFQEEVQMYVYEELVEGKKLTEIINTEHENVKYLKGFKLPENIKATPDVVTAAKDADILVFVVPHQVNNFYFYTVEPRLMVTWLFQPNFYGLPLPFVSETSTTTSANQNKAGNEVANAVDETQATSNNANGEVQAADDGDVEMASESSTDNASMDVVEVVPGQEAVVQSA